MRLREREGEEEGRTTFDSIVYLSVAAHVATDAAGTVTAANATACGNATDTHRHCYRFCPAADTATRDPVAVLPRCNILLAFAIVSRSQKQRSPVYSRHTEECHRRLLKRLRCSRCQRQTLEAKAITRKRLSAAALRTFTHEHTCRVRHTYGVRVYRG